jgi:hypothetical protein
LRLILAYLFFAFFTLRATAQNPVIFIQSPAEYQLAGNNLPINVAVNFVNPITSVKAFIGANSTLLTFNPLSERYTGNLSLTGLVQDTLLLNVSAIDNLNNTDTVQQPIIYDLPPGLIMEMPVNWSIARPTIPIKARCTDNSNHCQIAISANMNGGQNGSFGVYTDSVNTVIDLSAFDGNYGSLVFTAIDIRNQQTTGGTQIVVESSPYLEQVYAGPDQILDFNYNKVFINGSFIQDITTLNSIPIPSVSTTNGYVSPYNGHITPYGAMVSAGTRMDYINNYDFNTDSLYDIGPGDGLFNVKGNFAAFARFNRDIVLRNLTLKSDTTISLASYDGEVGYDLTADGAMVFSESLYGGIANVYKYANGITTVITKYDEKSTNVFPLTDGNLIVYDKKSYNCNCNDSIYLNNGSSDIFLSNLPGIFMFDPHNYYQVNNGMVVYSAYDSAHHIQLWLRDSSGRNTAVTSFNSDSYLEQMDSHGDFTFTRYNSPFTKRRYFASSSGDVKDISSWMGTIYFRNNTYYLALGNTLFKVNLSIPPNRVNSSKIYLPKDSVYHFQTVDFTSQFKGPGQLVKIKITSLPEQGSLTLNGTNISLNQELFGSDANNLIYTPGNSYSGDSIGWNGFNGTSYTTSSGIITFSQNPLPLPCDTLTPYIKLTSSSSEVTSTISSLKLTIANATGAGTGPQYTFASDAVFANILQGPSTNTTLLLDPATMKPGANWYFARMQSSDSCATNHFAYDSVQIKKQMPSGLIDPDYPDQPIFEYPNPVIAQIVVSGLQPVKSYRFSLTDVRGQRLLLQTISNSSMISLQSNVLSTGMYLLEVYDETKGRTIGTIRLLAK